MDRTDRLGLRVNPQDKKRWKEAAAKVDMSMSAWIEINLNRIANDMLGQKSDTLDGQMSLVDERE